MGYSKWCIPCGFTPADCDLAYSPKGALDYSSSKININNPGINNAVEGNAPSWNATDGWISDGTNNWLATQVFTITENSSYIIRYKDLVRKPADWAYLLEKIEGSETVDLLFYDNTYFGVRINDADTTVAGDYTSGAIIAFSKNGVYVNGVFIKPLSFLPTPFTDSAHQFYISSQFSLFGRVGSKIQAMAIYNKPFSPIQVAELTTNMAAL